MLYNWAGVSISISTMVILKTLCLELSFRQIIHKIFLMYVDDISERC